MERFADDLCSSAEEDRNRLRLLQWALNRLVRQLGEEGVYGGGWIKKARTRSAKNAPNENSTKHWAQLKEHLKEIGSL